jgi:hypothetical protein
MLNERFAKITRPAVIGLFVALVSGCYVYYRHAEGEPDELYSEVTADTTFQGSAKAIAAVKKLGTYRGRRVAEMLRQIAVGLVPVVRPEIRSEAISVLGERHDPAYATDLALLLQPHETITIRDAAANALRECPCEDGCVMSILYYLERIWQGEPNYEGRSIAPPGLREKVKAREDKEESELYDALNGILQREAGRTVRILARVHGLGTDAPSNFALILSCRIGLREACPLLIQSEQLLSQSHAALFTGPRTELETTLNCLKCNHLDSR